MLTHHFNETLNISNEENTQRIYSALEIIDELDDNLSEIRPTDLDFVINTIFDDKLKEQVRSLNWSDIY